MKCFLDVLFCLETFHNEPFQYLAMQNGGLSRMLGSNNPYSLWSGGGVTGTGPLQIPGMSNKIDPYAPLNAKQLQNLYSTGRLSNQQMSAGQLAGGNMNFNAMFGPTKQEQEDDEVAADDEEDMGVIETYSNYWPTKLKVLQSLNLLLFYVADVHKHLLSPYF